MAQVKVLVSADRRWRVDVRPDGRAEVREHGFLRATVREPGLRAALARLGVELDQLLED